MHVPITQQTQKQSLDPIEKQIPILKSVKGFHRKQRKEEVPYFERKKDLSCKN